MNHAIHQPVLEKEILAAIDPLARTILDGTVGDGGHAKALCAHCQHCTHYLALDRDEKSLIRARERLQNLPQVHFFHSTYQQAAECVQSVGLSKVDVILLDLGFSSAQIQDASRGMSFMEDGPLDMRYDQTDGETAAQLLATRSEQMLKNIFSECGNEPLAPLIAHEIIMRRKHQPIISTFSLRDFILDVYRRKLKSTKEVPWIGGIHPATRTFQALRIAVNNELEILSRSLPQLFSLLSLGGRLLIVSFHSGEDAIVKEFFARESRDCICPKESPVCICKHKKSLLRITKKPITASQAELEQNPRSRSAKLRIAEKIT